MLPKYMITHKYVVIFLAILVVAISLTLQYFGWIMPETKEGFDAIPVEYDKANPSKPINGYYLVDSKSMALVPYGYAIDPTDPYKIIPVSNAAKLSLKLGDKAPKMPVPGEMMPERYYLNETSLGVLPPNMMPDVKSVDVNYNTVPPSILVYYNNGYVSNNLYYEKKFTPISKVTNPLPKEIYFVDKDMVLVSFVPYGQIADVSSGYGTIPNPDLISNSGKFDMTDIDYKNPENNNYDLSLIHI
jgi:hypothetical protein